MMKTFVCVAAVAAAAFVASPASAQLRRPVALEIRGNAAIPTADLHGEAETGYGFSARAMVDVVPGFGVYGGYSRTWFGVSDDDDTSDDIGDLIDSGWTVGGRVSLPVMTSVSPYLSAGAVFHEIQEEDVDGDPSSDIGFEAELGVSLPLGTNLAVTPAVNYRQYEQSDLQISYFNAGVGLKWTF